MDEIFYDLSELADVAGRLLLQSDDRRVWAFHGEMGAGKTTLIKALGQQMEVTDPMSSPSFAIVNEYATRGHGSVYHFDFYRLKEEMEAVDIGVEDYFYSGSFCFVEWPERVPSLLPDRHLKINIKLVDEFTRNLSLELT